MTRSPLHTVTKDDDLNKALKLLEQHGLNQVPVIDGERLVGLLSRTDIINYLQLRQELAIKPNKKASSMGVNRTVFVVLGTLIGFGSICGYHNLGYLTDYFCWD